MDDVELGRRILARGLLPREVLSAAYARRGTRSLEQVLLQDRLLSADHLRSVSATPAPSPLGWDSDPAGDLTRLDDDDPPADEDLEATLMDLDPPDRGAAPAPPQAAPDWAEDTQAPGDLTRLDDDPDGERTLIDGTVLTPPRVDLARMQAADVGPDVTRMDAAPDDSTRMDEAGMDDSTRMDPQAPPAPAAWASSSGQAIRPPDPDVTFAPGLDDPRTGPQPQVDLGGATFAGTPPAPTHFGAVAPHGDATFAPGLAPSHPGSSGYGHPSASGRTPTFAELGSQPGAISGRHTFADGGVSHDAQTFADAGLSHDGPPLDSDATFADVSRPGEPGFGSAPDPDVVQLPRNPGETGRLGAYLLLEELGRGGMGAVYRAQDPAGREVAIKIILGEFYSDTIKERFVREGQVTAALSHPGIVRVLGAGTAGKTPYLVYELVTGAQSFKSIYGRLPLEEQVAKLRDACRALEVAHARGVVHRDVKPDNLLLDQAGNVRVADFGLAAGKDLDRLTRTGAQLGTPAYMAPEQIDARREDLGPPTDVWALGVMLYEILTGERPFKGKSFKDLCLQITAPNPPLPRKLNPQVPRDLEAVCMRCLSERAEDRYATAGKLADDLDRALNEEAVEAKAPPRFGKRTKYAALGALVLGLACAGLGALAVFGQGGGEAAVAKLTLSLTSPRDDGEVGAPVLEVTGRVLGRATWARVRVDLGLPQDDPATPPPIRVRTGEVFTVPVSLPPGQTRIRVLASDAEDPAVVAAPIEHTITYVSGPSWYRKLPPDERPRLPFGLTPGSIEGEYVWGPDGSVLVWIPPGTFTQGPMEGSLGLELGNEQVGVVAGKHPVREVTISRGFFLGKYEVSVEQWERYARETGARDPVRHLNLQIVPTGLGTNDWLWGDGVDFTLGDTHPALNISHVEARAYCSWAGLRLPTEAEWEYAACGGQRVKYPWGNEDPSHLLTNMLGEDDGYAYTAPRAAFRSDVSGFGVYNMGGNVSEHVADWLAAFPEGEAVDPTGPDTGARRVIRGGSWSLEWAPIFTVFSRDSQIEDDTDWRVGFRVALAAPQ